MDAILPLNEHYMDRAVRVVGGAALISLAFVGPQTPWGWLGAIFVVTGLIGRCPIYRLLGIGTR